MPPPPCGSPCTGRLAVGPPRPRPPPEPPMTPITALNPKAHPLLPPQHPLPQCPFPLDLRGLFSALPTTTNSLQEGPRPGSTVREGDLGIVCFHRWHLPSGHGQIASSSCKPLAALDGRRAKPDLKRPSSREPRGKETEEAVFLPSHPTSAVQTPREDSGPRRDDLSTPGSGHALDDRNGAQEGHGLRGHAWPPPSCPHLPLPGPDTRQERHTPQGRPWPLPGPQHPLSHPSLALPASHLRSPARQARPPPEREASSCSLIARAGERSHHRGGRIGPRPTGPGSRGPWRCSVAGESAAEAWEGAQEARVSARQLGTRQSGRVPLSQDRPAPHPRPDTCDHRPLPLAEAQAAQRRTGTPASFPQSEFGLGLQTAPCMGPGPSRGPAEAEDKAGTTVETHSRPPAAGVRAGQAGWLSPAP
ncbi:hypothetical protein AB1E18_009229 [Capra hircus]